MGTPVTRRSEALAAGVDAEIVLRVEDLRMNYGRKEVLKGIDLTARRGEIITLLGPNGAGKTTTLEVLEGFRRRSSGKVDVLGSDPEHGDEAWRARLGVVLQSWRDHGAWKVRDLLHHFGRFHAPYSTPDRLRPYDTDTLLALVGLTEHAGQRIKHLSGGQRRRLDVAIGVVGRPEILFLDEPTAGFDPKARQAFHDLLFRLVDEEDTTILLTTHDLDEAAKLSDRVLLLAGGRIVTEGSPDELAASVAGDSEVTWTVDGRRHVHGTDAPARHIAELYAVHGDGITDLKVTRTSLEDVYMTMVRRYESGDAEVAPADLDEENR